MITRRDLSVALVAAAATPGVVAAHAQKTLMRSALFDRNAGATPATCHVINRHSQGTKKAQP